MTKLSDAGFGLVEMMVALGLVGVALAIAMPMAGRSMSAAKLRTTASDLASAAALARSAALRTGRSTQLVVDPERRTYQVAGSGGPMLIPADISMHVTGATGEVRRERSSIVFYPDGGASGGVVVLYDGRQRVTISVNWATGGAHVR